MRALPTFLAAFTLAALCTLAEGQEKRFAQAHLLFPEYGQRPDALAGADFDGDGRGDILLGHQSYRRLALGDGTGAFVDASERLGPYASGAARDIDAADVDGDGDVDAFVSVNLGTNVLLLNDGAATFSDGSTGLPWTGMGWEFTQASTFGDVDGDGDPDLLLFNGSGHPNMLWRNDGLGTFAYDTTSFPLSWAGDPGDVLATDLDSDGDLDAVFVGEHEAVLLNDGAGGFAEVADAIAGYPAFGLLRADAGDVNADGAPDLLAAASFQPYLFVNVGGGHLADATDDLPPPPGGSFSGPFDAALRDFDGDGDLDALLPHSFSSTAHDRLFLNDGRGAFSDASASLPQVLHSGAVLFADDLDADGDVDAILGVKSQCRIWRNDGAAALVDVTTDWPLESLLDQDAALGDVDADGDLDALFAGSSSSRLYRNGGVGDFADATPGLGFALQGGNAGLLGDVDGDGADDALLFRDADALYLADGAGGLLPAAAGFPQDGATTYDAALGDADGDGDLDAILVNYTQTRLYRNAGGGAFTFSAADMPASLPSMQKIALGDLDGDGDLDAFIGTTMAPANPYDVVLLNDGGGTYALASGALPSFLDTSTGVALFDADGDGDLDALTANGYAEGDRLYTNGGAAVFTDASDKLPAGAFLGPAEIAAADFDLDGDPDVLGRQQYWTSAGGAFADASLAMPWVFVTGSGSGTGSGSNGIAVGDVDGDGDPDAVLARGALGSDVVTASDALYSNLTRQVVRRTAPAVGKPYTLSIHGAPFSAFFFAWGSTPGAFPVPPYGVLRLHPGALLVLDSAGLIGPSGRVDKTFHAPSEPIWVGVTVYWQALLGTPLAFTNLEATTFTDL